MNYIDLMFILIVLLMAIGGYLRGFIVSIISLVRFAIGVPLAFFISEKYNGLIYDNFLKERALLRITKKLAETANVDTFVGNITDSANKLPSFLKGTVDLSALDNVTNDNVAKIVLNNFFEPVAIVILKVLLFVLTFLLFYLLTRIIMNIVNALSHSDKMPFKKTNKFLGAVFGLAKSAIAVFAIAAIFKFIVDSNLLSNSNEFLKQLNASKMLEYINLYNPISSLM